MDSNCKLVVSGVVLNDSLENQLQAFLDGITINQAVGLDGEIVNELIIALTTGIVSGLLELITALLINQAKNKESKNGISIEITTSEGKRSILLRDESLEDLSSQELNDLIMKLFKYITKYVKDNR